MAQYEGAIGIAGTLANGHVGSGSFGPRRPLRVYASGGAEMFSFQAASDPGATTGVDIYWPFKVVVSLSGGGVTTIGPSPDVLIFAASGPGFDVTCHTYEVTFKLGTYVAPDHLPDGNLKVFMDGVLILSAEGLALGQKFWDGWSGIVIGPCGAIRTVYVRDVNERCPGFGRALEVQPFTSDFTDLVCGASANMLYNRNFTGATDADIFADAGGPWTRSIPGTNPLIDTGWITSNTGTTISRFDFAPTLPPIIPPQPCECEPPPTVPPTLPPIIPKNPPQTPPIIGQQLACVGGGVVPTQPDLVYSENWWNL